MKRSLFGPNTPGEFVSVENGEAAFVPKMFVDLATYELTGEQWRVLLDAKQAVGELTSLLRAEVSPVDASLLLSQLRREESLRSSSIEGTYATPEELLLYEQHPSEELSSDATEVDNYNAALAMGMPQYREQGLTHALIRALHQRLMSGARGEDKSPGAYRDGQVFIGTDHRFTPPPGHLVSELLDDMIEYARAPSDDLPASVRACLLHYQFETIHPFRDGNGRVGRLLLSLMLSDASDLDEAWFFLSPYFDEHRREYIERLFTVSTDNDWESWVSFCLRAMLAQARRTQAQVMGLIRLYRAWRDGLRETNAPGGMYRIVEHLFGSPVINTETAMELLSVTTLDTARKRLAELMKLGALMRIKSGREVWYLATPILRIVHSGYKD